MGLPTHPQREPDTMIRHVSASKVMGVTLCAFLVPHGAGAVSVHERGRRTVVTLEGDLRARIGFDTAGFRI